MRIANRDQIDGQPQTVGASLSFQATATDGQGRDISGLIEWLDHQGRPMGSGPSFTYNAGREPLMETITARVRTPEGESSDRVSFTVSTPDVVVAPNVKVLPDQETQIVSFDFDPEAEEQTLSEYTLVIVNSERIPTLEVGDVIVGADRRVPPMKIKTLQSEGENLRIGLELTPFHNLIADGSVSFEDEINIDLRSLLDSSNYELQGDLRTNRALSYQRGGRVPIPIPILPNPLYNPGSLTYLRDRYPQFIPSAADFVFPLIALGPDRVETSLLRGGSGRRKRSGLRFQLDALSQVYGGYDFDIDVSGNMDFEYNPFMPNFGLGGFDFGLAFRDTTVFGVTLDGTIKVDQAFEGVLMEKPIHYIAFAAGPLPGWIEVKFVSKFSAEPSMSLSARGVHFGARNDRSYSINISYDRYYNGHQAYIDQDSHGDYRPISAGETYIEGAIKLQWKNELEFKLYSLGGPKVGVTPSITPSVGARQTTVKILPEFGLPGLGDYSRLYSVYSDIPLRAVAEVQNQFKIDGKVALELTAFSAKNFIGDNNVDLGRQEFTLYGGTVFTAPVGQPFRISSQAESPFWIGWKDSELGFIAESLPDERIWLESCFYRDQGNDLYPFSLEGLDVYRGDIYPGVIRDRQISAALFHSADPNGEYPLAESLPLNLRIYYPKLDLCNAVTGLGSSVHPVIESIEFPREIEDGQAYPLKIRAGLRHRPTWALQYNSPLNVEVRMVRGSDGAIISRSTGTTDEDGFFTTDVTLTKNLGVLKLEVEVWKELPYKYLGLPLPDGASPIVQLDVPLRDTRRIYARDICNSAEDAQELQLWNYQDTEESGYGGYESDVPPDEPDEYELNPDSCEIYLPPSEPIFP